MKVSSHLEIMHFSLQKNTLIKDLTRHKSLLFWFQSSKFHVTGPQTGPQTGPTHVFFDFLFNTAPVQQPKQKKRVTPEDLRKLPEKAQPDSKRKKPAGLPSLHFNSQQNLDFISTREKNQIRDAANDKSLPPVPKLTSAKRVLQLPGTNKAKAISVPQILGQVDFKCSLCETLYGDRGSALTGKTWVRCPVCKKLYHFGCLKIDRECLCGQKVSIQRNM